MWSNCCYRCFVYFRNKPLKPKILVIALFCRDVWLPTEKLSNMGVEVFQFHVDERTWDYYMGRMLLHLWRETGHVYMAVCAGGSALCKPIGGGLRYSQLLAELPSGLEVITPIICGNDFYKKKKDRCIR